LLDKERIKQIFLKVYAVEQQYQPGTVKSHLNSLIHFYDYWLLTASVKLPGNKENELTAMKQTVKTWIASYRKEANKRNLEKMDSDLQKTITPDDIAKFSSSEPAKNAIKLLGSAARGVNLPPSKQEYTTVRDYLLTEKILHNANRPGPLANMQEKYVQEARLINDHYAVSVPDHKTSSVHGPAKIVLTKTLHSWLMVFVNKILDHVPALSSSDSAMVFRSWTGESLDSGQVGRCMKSVFKKADLSTCYAAPQDHRRFVLYAASRKDLCWDRFYSSCTQRI
jgi:hypothetical protein